MYPHEPFLNFAYPDSAADPLLYNFQVVYTAANQRSISDYASGGHDWDGDTSDDVTTDLRDPEGALINRNINVYGIMYNFGHISEGYGLEATGEINFYGSLMVNTAFNALRSDAANASTIPHIYYDERIDRGVWPPPELKLPRVYVSFMDTDEY